jgi:hypothetical protein
MHNFGHLNLKALYYHKTTMYICLISTPPLLQSVLHCCSFLYVGTEKRGEKVVVLRELQRAIIYTNELSKQAIEGHVNTAFTVYSMNEGARLTHPLRYPCWMETSQTK